METKDLLALVLIPSAIAVTSAAACLSQRLRDLVFFGLVFGTVLAERISVNFASHYWYRGTVRGFEFSIVDILALSLLLSSVLFPRYRDLGRYWPVSLGLMILYFLYAAFSIAVSHPKLFGLFELSKMFRSLIVFLAVAWFVRSERELRILVLALGFAVCFEGMYALKQRFIGGLYRVEGNLDHPNSLSMYLCLAAPVFVATAASTMPRLLRYFASSCLALSVVMILLTVSRAGIPAFFFIVLGTALFTVSLRPTLTKCLGVACLALAMAGLVASQWQNLVIRFQIERSLEEEYFDEQSEGRGHYFLLAKAIVDDQFFGVGLNNWSYWVCKRYGADRGWFYLDYDDLDYIPPKEALSNLLFAPPAHNLAALTVGELGWPGLVIFLLLWARWFQAGAKFLRRRSADPMDRLGTGIYFSIWGVFLQSITEWIFRQTPILFGFHILLGVLASLYWQKRRSAKWQQEQDTAEIEAADSRERACAQFE
ncbi:MAG: O-antigen ligase family protein [Verrucomicrobia bacterium]|nr:O-antigen ligase family protein [Verrucomicrobiota bacterium]